MGFAQQRHRFLNMQNIEQHRVVRAGIRTSCSVGEEIALFSADSGVGGLPCPAFGYGQHLRVNVQSEHGALNPLGCRQSERPVPAAKLDYIPERTRAVELLDYSCGIEKGHPVGHLGHSAFAAFHGQGPPMTPYLRLNVIGGNP